MLQGSALLVCGGAGDAPDAGSGSHLNELLAHYGIALHSDALISIVQQVGWLQHALQI